MSEEKNKPVRKLYYPVMYEVFLGLQFLASVGFLYIAWDRFKLSFPMLLGGIVLLSFFLMVIYYLLFSRLSSLIRLIARIICVLFSISLIVAAGMIKVTTDATSEIGMDEELAASGVTKEHYTICIAVREDSSYQSLSDLSGVKIGYNRIYDEKMLPGVKELFSKETSITPLFDDFSNFKYMVDDLFSDDPGIGAVLFNEVDKKAVKKCFKKYDAKMRILGKYEIECEEQLALTAVSDVTSDPFIVYLSGLDTRSDSVGKERTDANQIVIVNPQTEQLLFLGIPRDYYVDFASFDKKDKFNHSGNYGIKESIAILENLLDMKINYYGQIKFQGAIDIVDAVGGLDIYNPASFPGLDDVYYYEEGNLHMDGDMALYFMRSRKLVPGGDNARVSNQTRVLKALITKLCDPSVFAKSYNGILKAMKDNVHTNMTSTELNDLIQMQITKIPKWDMNNFQLKGSDGKDATGHYLMIPDESSIEEAKGLIRKVLEGEIIDLKTLDQKNESESQSGE